GRDGGDAGPRPIGPGGPGQPAKTLKAFIKDRAQSVKDQLAGKTEGQTFMGRGFGGPGGLRGGRRGGPGGLPPLGLATVLGGPIMAAMDSNKDGEVTRAEFAERFANWFEAWNTDKSGLLTDQQLRVGLGRDLLPIQGVPPGGLRPPVEPPSRK
ncbi:MAG: hypothetical protein HYY23_08015, partial [Verrucomicrobia bacterium]|nr:hypothetical protein [Verrucomicrobiota bacterium]